MVAERLRRRIAAESFAIAQSSRQIPVTISIGIAARGDSGDNAAAILKRADTAADIEHGGLSRPESPRDQFA